MINRGRIAGMTRNGCFVCKKLCDSKCSRCFELYCSVQCQTIDWREHKYNCFRMPELTIESPAPNVGQHRQNGHHSTNQQSINNVPSLLNGHSTQPSLTLADSPKNKTDVVLVFVVSANTFYIRSLDYDCEYMKDSHDFDHYGRHAENVVSLPRKNDLVLVKYQGIFLRAVILQAESDTKIHVALADIGKTIWVSLRDMRQMNEDLTSRLRYNFRMSLEQIPQRIDQRSYGKLLGMGKDRTKFTLQYDGSDWTSAWNLKLIRKSDGLPLELAIREETNDGAPGITTTMEPVESQVEETTSNQSQKKLISIDDLPTETLPQLADLMVLSNSSIARTGCVSAILNGNIQKFNQLFERVDEYGKTNSHQPQYKPEPDELCLAKFNNEWYRAMYCPPTFCLIDYGCFEDIDDADIRQFPEELMDPCYTFICNIDGFSRDQQVNQIKQLLVLLAENSIHLKCTCVKVDDEYEVTFPCFPPS